MDKKSRNSVKLFAGQKKSNYAHNRRLILITVSIVVAVVSTLVLTLVLSHKQEVDFTEASKSTTIQPPYSSNESIVTEEIERPIVYGDDDIIGQEIPPPGKCYISGGVASALSNTTNYNSLFYIKLWIYDTQGRADFETSFTFEGKTSNEWYEIFGTDSEYGAGLRDYHVKIGNDPDWWINNFGADQDEVLKNGDGDEAWNKMYQEWDDIWYETHEIRPHQKYLEYMQAYENAEKKYAEDLVKDETERLESQGLNVWLEENERGYDLIGLLSKEQIEDFPCGNYGYMILWADKEDIINQ